MENSGKEESEEPRVERSKVSTSKKTRRSVVRSFSRKKSKKLKMEEPNKEQSFDGSDEDDVGSFEKRENAMSNEDDDLNETGSSSIKRKRFGVWKAMKRIFTRRSGKGSKSFTHGGSTTQTSYLHRSISDPNLMSRSNPPEVAPLEQVDSAMHTEVVVSSPPKKYLSHDSLISELRAKRGKSIGNEKLEDNRRENPSIIVSSKSQGVNWQVPPSSDREKLVPGLNVSHDKIRVAPRHRRAPSRKGVASVRHHDRVDGDIIPRSNSVGVSSPSFVLKNPQEPVDFGELIQSLRSHQGENAIIENNKEDVEVSMEEEPSSQQEETTKKSQEISETVSDEIHESKERDFIEKNGNVHEVPEVNELKETINEDKTMEITPATVETLEVKTKYGDERDQQSVEETEKARKYSDHQHKSLPKHDETDKLVDITVSLSKTASTPVTELDFKLTDECVFGDNVDISMSPITEPVPVTNDKPAYKEDPAEELPVEPIGSDPEPVPESISKSVNKEYVEVVLDNQIATTENLPCPVSVPVSLELPDVDKDEDISKVEPEQKTNHSPSSDDEPSTNITNVIPESKLTDSSIVEATVTSPVRRRLNIVTPENVFQKPIMSNVVINENKSQQEPEGIQRRRPQSLYIPKLANKLEEEGRSKDDSNAGVARLTEAFERTYRTNTISLGEKRKKPDVLPKPKFLSQSSEERVQTPYETQSLGRNFKLVKPVSKQMEEQIIINDDTIEQDVLDRNKINEKSDVVVKSPTKKPERRGTAPKPPPKPKIFKESKPALNAKSNITVLKDEGKEDIQGNSVPKPIRNGSTKISEKESLNDKINIVGENKDDQPVAALPSFWAKRNLFSSGNSSASSEEPMTTKEVSKPTPMFQLKIDTCVVCDSKVYQMEKCKVKDNVVHKRCVKCCSCKRKLSVGNVIMAENKIYCKLHEPSHTIALST